MTERRLFIDGAVGLGRLAAPYRRQFGETPSATLAHQDGAIATARSTNQTVATVPAK